MADRAGQVFDDITELGVCSEILSSSSQSLGYDADDTTDLYSDDIIAQTSFSLEGRIYNNVTVSADIRNFPVVPRS